MGMHYEDCYAEAIKGPRKYKTTKKRRKYVSTARRLMSVEKRLATALRRIDLLEKQIAAARQEIERQLRRTLTGDPVCE